MLVLAFVLSFIFLVVYYPTPDRGPAQFYFVIVWVVGFSLPILPWFFKKFKRGAAIPMPFMKNAKLYAYVLGLLIVPFTFVVSEAVQGLNPEMLVTYSSLIPELWSHIYKLVPFAFAPIAFVGPDTSAIVQQFGYQIGDIGPGEEMFKTAVVNLSFLPMTAREGEYSRWTVGGVLTLVNFIWTVLHAVVSYTQLNEFIIAFTVGEVLLLMTMIFRNPFPSVIGHATWNAMSGVGYITLPIMIGMAGLLIVLLAFAAYRARKKS